MFMRELNLNREETNLENEIKNIFNVIRNHTQSTPPNLFLQIEKLLLLRSEIYEDLNQLQHKGLILKAAKLLQDEFPEINRWSWHPKQTSSPNEADLTGYDETMVILNAEITTSLKPVGTIDMRMKKTLISLSGKNGKRFYFVQTVEMLNRANAKIMKNKWDILARMI